MGASPLVSAAFHDEPTVDEMNSLGLDVTSVGNHEFDEGVTELLRLQNGGCHPVDGCQDGDGFAGADYPMLAANVVYRDSNQPILAPYTIEKIGGVKVAFVGMTLEGTPGIVNPAGITNVNFLDEAETANRYAYELRHEHGVRSIVLLLHEGGQQSVQTDLERLHRLLGRRDRHRVAAGPGVRRGRQRPHAPALRLCAAELLGRQHPRHQRGDQRHHPDGHQHHARQADPSRSSRPTRTTSSSRTGSRTRTGPGRRPRRACSSATLPPSTPTAKVIADKYRTAVAPLANRVVGSITADITRDNNAAGESALGDVIADGMVAYTVAGAQLALMNPGGIRASLTFANSPGGEAPGQVTYGEVFTVQPFNNLVVTVTLTGAQLKEVLEQQWAGYAGQTRPRSSRCPPDSPTPTPHPRHWAVESAT